jgi:hypothetical protein
LKLPLSVIEKINNPTCDVVNDVNQDFSLKATLLFNKRVYHQRKNKQ